MGCDFVSRRRGGKTNPIAIGPLAGKMTGQFGLAEREYADFPASRRISVVVVSHILAW